MKVVKMDQVSKEPFLNPIFTGSDVTRQTLVPDSKDFNVKLPAPTAGRHTRGLPGNGLLFLYCAPSPHLQGGPSGGTLRPTS
jgi:hypothetical protein